MLTAVILAAGKGTRMKSDKPKVLFEAAGKAMLSYVIDAAKEANADKIIVVIGSCADKVKSEFSSSGVDFCFQEEQKGTADAVKCALPLIDDDSGVLILCGDMPLIKGETLKKFIEHSENDINFISVKSDNPKGYGRVIRSPSGAVLRITEEKDANENEKKINEINSGVYYCKSRALKNRLLNINNNNSQNEYYLTDIVIGGSFAWEYEDEKEFSGVNDREQLAAVSRILWRRRASFFMKEGVTIVDPDAFYCDEGCEIGGDTIIYPNVYLEKSVKIGSHCTVRSGVRIVSSVISDNCDIKDNTLIEYSEVGSCSSVGPMAHLREGSVLKGDNKIGNFVETKKTTIGLGSKASHLTYLGDASLGSGVNIGCGTITCNYDGYNKHRTNIGNNVFVGSDVQFVAPVTIGDGALIGAGTTVTKNVPPDALALSRAKQVNKEGLGKAILEQNRQEKEN